MPLDPSIVQDVLANIQSDIEGGFDGILAPKNGFAFGLLDSEIQSDQAVALSDNLVVAPWQYDCVHIGVLADVPATHVEFVLRGVTVAHVVDGDPDNALYHRYIDYLGALHQIGVSTAVRPALDPAQYDNWSVRQ